MNPYVSAKKTDGRVEAQLQPSFCFFHVTSIKTPRSLEPRNGELYDYRPLISAVGNEGVVRSLERICIKDRKVVLLDVISGYLRSTLTEAIVIPMAWKVYTVVTDELRLGSCFAASSGANGWQDPLRASFQ